MPNFDTDALAEMEACRVSPEQLVQTVSVDVGSAEQVEKMMVAVVAKQGPVTVRKGQGREQRGGLPKARRGQACAHSLSCPAYCTA